ncbi:hypothetical protein BDR26DRAFT_850564 [Obelidium mucronatum]|nr:hypothetical protein BDR26DRAFT_880344 [Obelidium mucronatum]KAI9352219.1 hypothetical protein BDR26DRAFT_850564 [Obelidium mucronatum]
MWTVHLVLSKNTSFNVLLELMYLLWLGVVYLNILSSASVASSTSSLGDPLVSMTLWCRSLHKMKMVFLSSKVL